MLVLHLPCLDPVSELISPTINGFPLIKRNFISVPGTSLYFGIYEFTKRNLTANSIPEVVAHLAAGSLGDLAASVVYVPSEVLKTRLQLQGRYNNPHFVSGYNYGSTWHAAKTVS
jgi:hypothetical protein